MYDRTGGAIFSFHLQSSKHNVNKPIGSLLANFYWNITNVEKIEFGGIVLILAWGSVRPKLAGSVRQNFKKVTWHHWRCHTREGFLNFRWWTNVFHREPIRSNFESHSALPATPLRICCEAGPYIPSRKPPFLQEKCIFSQLPFPQKKSELS